MPKDYQKWNVNIYCCIQNLKSNITYLLLPLYLLFRECRNLHNPSRERLNLQGPPQTRPPTYLLRRTCARRLSLRTLDQTCDPSVPRPQRGLWCCSTCRLPFELRPDSWWYDLANEGRSMSRLFWQISDGLVVGVLEGGVCGQNRIVGLYHCGGNLKKQPTENSLKYLQCFS